jgi:hypothetical protein
MELTLVGHDSLYQVEQLQQALFSLNQEGTAVSKVERTEDAVRFITTITVGGKVTEGVRTLPVTAQTVPASTRSAVWNFAPE